MDTQLARREASHWADRHSGKIGFGSGLVVGLPLCWTIFHTLVVQPIKAEHSKDVATLNAKIEQNRAEISYLTKTLAYYQGMIDSGGGAK